MYSAAPFWVKTFHSINYLCPNLTWKIECLSFFSWELIYKILCNYNDPKLVLLQNNKMKLKIHKKKKKNSTAKSKIQVAALAFWMMVTVEELGVLFKSHSMSTTFFCSFKWSQFIYGSISKKSKIGKERRSEQRVFWVMD